MLGLPAAEVHTRRPEPRACAGRAQCSQHTCSRQSVLGPTLYGPRPPETNQGAPPSSQLRPSVSKHEMASVAAGQSGTAIANSAVKAASAVPKLSREVEPPRLPIQNGPGRASWPLSRIGDPQSPARGDSSSYFGPDVACKDTNKRRPGSPDDERRNETETCWQASSSRNISVRCFFPSSSLPSNKSLCRRCRRRFSITRNEPRYVSSAGVRRPTPRPARFVDERCP